MAILWDTREGHHISSEFIAIPLNSNITYINHHILLSPLVTVRHHLCKPVSTLKCIIKHFWFQYIYILNISGSSIYIQKLQYIYILEPEIYIYVTVVPAVVPQQKLKQCVWSKDRENRRYKWRQTWYLWGDPGVLQFAALQSSIQPDHLDDVFLLPEGQLCAQWALHLVQQQPLHCLTQVHT